METTAKRKPQNEALNMLSTSPKILTKEDQLLKQVRKLEAEKQALQEEKARLSELVGTLAHELKNPVGLIQTFSGLLVKSDFPIGEAQRQRTLAAMFSSSQVAVALVADLQDYWELHTRSAVLRPQTNDLELALGEKIASYQILADKRGVGIAFHPLGLAPFRFDSSKCRQALHNLLHNAMRFTPDGQDLAVRIAREGDMVRVEVRHGGEGIPARENHDYFDLFQDFGIPALTSERNNGLGMAVVRQVALLHGGRAEAVIQHGKVEAFAFSLPLID